MKKRRIAKIKGKEKAFLPSLSTGRQGVRVMGVVEIGEKWS